MGTYDTVLAWISPFPSADFCVGSVPKSEKALLPDLSSPRRRLGLCTDSLCGDKGLLGSDCLKHSKQCQTTHGAET